jgi:histidyl-tRNA synthetase
MLKELRVAGIASEVFSGDTKNLTRQIRYADKLGIPLAVIAGSNEFDSGLIRIKNLAAGASKAGDTSGREDWLKAEGFQEDIPRERMVARIKELLGF